VEIKKAKPNMLNPGIVCKEKPTQLKPLWTSIA
jgi:hypothetical protein